jgi:two-component system, chemotaxis family, response regulator Rcp1
MSDQSAEKPIQILLADDDPGDVRLTREALKSSTVHCRLNVVSAGDEVLPFLHRQGKYFDAAPPDIILLDLNMPRKDGREVLAEIKSDPALRHIPVVVLTTSESNLDIISIYDLHANCYITKPFDLSRFQKIVRSIDDFWFTTVKLPGR